MYPKFTTPKTLTAQEQGRLLRAVRAQGSRRDRAILSLALGTGLRLRELAGLNVGDVVTEGSGIPLLPLRHEREEGRFCLPGRIGVSPRGRASSRGANPGDRERP